jgi:hypothetical protein
MKFNKLKMMAILTTVAMTASTVAPYTAMADDYADADAGYYVEDYSDDPYVGQDDAADYVDDYSDYDGYASADDTADDQLDEYVDQLDEYVDGQAADDAPAGDVQPESNAEENVAEVPEVAAEDAAEDGTGGSYAVDENSVVYTYERDREGREYVTVQFDYAKSGDGTTTTSEKRDATIVEVRDAMDANSWVKDAGVYSRQLYLRIEGDSADAAAWNQNGGRWVNLCDILDVIEGVEPGFTYEDDDDEDCRSVWTERDHTFTLLLDGGEQKETKDAVQENTNVLKSMPATQDILVRETAETKHNPSDHKYTKAEFKDFEEFDNIKLNKSGEPIDSNGEVITEVKINDNGTPKMDENDFQLEDPSVPGVVTYSVKWYCEFCGRQKPYSAEEKDLELVVGVDNDKLNVVAKTDNVKGVLYYTDDDVLDYTEDLDWFFGRTPWQYGNYAEAVLDDIVLVLEDCDKDATIYIAKGYRHADGTLRFFNPMGDIEKRTIPAHHVNVYAVEVGSNTNLKVEWPENFKSFDVRTYVAANPKNKVNAAWNRAKADTQETSAYKYKDMYVSIDGEGEPVVKNNVCNKDGDYTLLSSCINDLGVKPVETEKTAEAGDHHLNDAEEDLLDYLERTIENDSFLTRDELEAIKTGIEDETVFYLPVRRIDDDFIEVKGAQWVPFDGSKLKNIVVVGDSTDTCVADGSVEFTFLCGDCKSAEMKKLTVTVGKHKPVQSGYSVRKTIVEATCEHAGEYISCQECVYCKLPIASTVKHFTEEKKPHTNQTTKVYNSSGVSGYVNDWSDEEGTLTIEGDIVVDSWPAATLSVGTDEEQYHDNSHLSGDVGTTVGNTRYSGLYVIAKVVTNCEVCGKNEAIVGAPAFEVVALEEDDPTTGTAGSITIKFTYRHHDGDRRLEEETRTFKYFRSLDSYRKSGGSVVPVPPTPDKKNGLVKDEDGIWRYYVNGNFAQDVTGIVGYDGGEFFVQNGILNPWNGLLRVDGKWYFMAEGQVQRGHNGFAEYDDHWFIITNGELDLSANGLFDYDGGKFLFAAGQLKTEVNGLWQNESNEITTIKNADGKWYFLSNGQVQNDYEGLALYDGEWFYVLRGVFQKGYNGVVAYDGKNFKVEDGMVVGEA